jgi:hypothetical protein
MFHESKNIYLFISFCLIFIACSKTKVGPQITPPKEEEDVVITPAVDPAVSNTVGFFLDAWVPKTFVAPSFTESTTITTASNVVNIDATEVIAKVPSGIFGHNAVWWMGPVSNEPKVVDPLKNLSPNIIRFPAGSGSDCYFWNQPEGVLPKDVPTLLTDKDGKTHNPGYRQGKSNLNWQCNLDDYYSLLQKTNSKGILTVNYGYARYGTSENPVATAAHLAADWVRYDNGKTQLWEIGNENFGDWEWGYRIDTKLNKDNQPEFLTGDLYAKHFAVFADSMRKAAKEIGNNIKIGAVVFDSEPQSWMNNCNKTWNETMLKNINSKSDFFAVHNYFTPYDQNSNATVVLKSALEVPKKQMDFLLNQFKNFGATPKPIAMDEWNMWAKDSKQQVSNTSGAFAVIVQAESIKNKYGMAARWDLLNGWDNGNDHGLFSSGEPGVDKWTMRPSFYYMYYFQKYFGDRMVGSTVTLGNGNTPSSIQSYASTYTSGQVNAVLLNTSGSPESVEIKIKNFNKGSRYYWYTLEGSNDNGQFSRKVLVNGETNAGIAGGPIGYATIKAKSTSTTSGIKVSVPAWGAVVLVVDKK